MINIYINNERADFFGSLSIKKDNALFTAPNVEPSAHTYTLTFPMTDANVNIFGLAQYTLNKPTEYPARIEVDGVNVFNGSCIITSIKKDSYSVYFTEVIHGGQGVKAMLTEERTLNEVIQIPESIDLQGGNGILLQSGGVAQIVEAYASSVYYRASLSKLQWLITEANLAFEINYLIDQIASIYGIDIAHLPSVYLSQLGERDEFGKTINNTITYWIRPQTSLPRLTPKDFLQNVAFALGYSMQVDYDTDTISFITLDAVRGVRGVRGVYDEPLEDISYDAINGIITFEEIEPYKYTKNKDEENEVEVAIPYSRDFKYQLGEGDAIYYKNKLSLPIASDPNEPNHITLPNVYEDDDKRLDRIVLCDYTIESGYYYLTPIDIEQYTAFGVYDRVNERTTTIKFKNTISPLDYSSLDMYDTILINGQRAYIKELNYNPEGESEITAYLI